jgi:hypothetical protein
MPSASAPVRTARRKNTYPPSGSVPVRRYEKKFGTTTEKGAASVTPAAVGRNDARSARLPSEVPPVLVKNTMEVPPGVSMPR